MEAKTSTENSIKQNLQERLHDAVKQCQTHFGARQEVATENDLRVNTLCTEWEAVLTHGLKKPKSNKLLGSFGKVDSMTGVALWPVVRPYLSNDELDRFMRLRFVNTDIGRGRSWLRASINERTLENYLHSILSDVSFLKKLYDSSSFILDEEKSTVLPVMAAGLGSIIFSLVVDAEYLNTPLKNIEVPAILPALRPTTSSVAAAIKPDFATRIGSATNEDDDDIVAISNRKVKKKTKKRSTTPPVQLDVDVTTPTNSPADAHTLSLDTPIIDTPIISNLTVEEKLSRDPSPASFDGTPHEEVHHSIENSLTSSPSLSIHSLNSTTDDTPLFIAPTDTQSAIEATNLVLQAAQGLEDTVLETPVAMVTMSEDEMREALKVLVKRKEEVEGAHQMTLLELSEKKEELKKLEKELEQLKQELYNKGDMYTQQQQALEKENDLLREQLKRYVGIVQQQQTNVSEQDQISTLSKKLSEMAEMYGELMEFNDHLHKEVQLKDNQLIKMAQTLHLAAIPLPVSPDLLPREAIEPKKIIEVWIPSVIKRGRGPDIHHVYQIYIKLGNDEWNVYRRFAEFYEFHKQLQKNLTEVSEFQFPPKKVIGRKTSQVIEERRQRLQEYLRFVLELCSKPNVKRKDGRIDSAFIYSGMDKDKFLKVLPFFNDTITATSNNTKVTPDERSLTRSPSYNGL